MHDTQGSRNQDQKIALVIDDEPLLRMIMVDALTDEGYHVLEAVDGVAGLEIFRAHPDIDVLVTDIGLPKGLTGKQVAEQARAVRPELATLFVTGYAATSDFNHTDLGANMDLLLKPFDMKEFIDKVAHLTRQPAS
jgi:CheY-like chemotaxis protein